MKKMIVSAFVLSVFGTAAYAQNATPAAAPAQPVAAATATAVPTTQDEQKTKIDVNALPEVVKKTLASDTYKAWEIVTAWEVKGATTYYVLEMKKGEETTTLKLNQEGKQIS